MPGMRAIPRHHPLQVLVAPGPCDLVSAKETATSAPEAAMIGQHSLFLNDGRNELGRRIDDFRDGFAITCHEKLERTASFFGDVPLDLHRPVSAQQNHEVLIGILVKRRMLYPEISAGIGGRKRPLEARPSGGLRHSLSQSLIEQSESIVGHGREISAAV